MSPFTQTHHAQNPVNIEILNFVNRRGHATWAELFAAFGDGSANEKGSTQRFSKKLEYLVYVEKLQATGRGRARSFYIGPMAGKPYSGRGRTDVCSAPCPLTPHYTPVTLTPPRQFNTMGAEPYVPPAQCAMRPGSLDYQRYASFGNRC